MRCKGVTNTVIFSFKTKPCNKTSESKLFKNTIGRYKINLEALKSYKAIADFICCMLVFTQEQIQIQESLKLRK
jgi:hypothetical protein